MATRVVTTASSVWTFDLDAKTYTRVPREDPFHPHLPYEQEPRAFTSVEPFQDNRLVVNHPDGVPFFTGRVESDVTTGGSARRLFAVANIRFAFSLDVEADAPSNRELTESLIESLRGDFTDEVITPLRGVLIDPTVDVKAVITSRPLTDTEHREEIAP